MTQARTALGTNSSKASATSLSINDVTLVLGAGMVVCIGYESSAGDPTSVQFGNRQLIKKGSTLTNTDFSLSFWVMKNNSYSGQRDIVATWGSALEARAMFATQIEEASALDVQQGRTVDATASMNTGVAAATTTVASTLHIAAFVSRGPEGDTVPSGSYGHAIGQRVGTTGGVDTTNVTICETYETLTATGDCRAAITGATSRDWCAGVQAYKQTQGYTIYYCDQHHRDMNEQPDWVVLRVSDEGTGAFTMRIDPGDFDDMTDAEVTEKVTQYCATYTQRAIDDASNVDNDSARNTRMATFVNDEIVL